MNRLPPSADTAIKQRFASLQEEGMALLTKMKQESSRSAYSVGHFCTQEFECLRTKLFNLLQHIGLTERDGHLVDEIKKAEPFVSTMERLLGLIQGHADDYEHGFLHSLLRRAEAEVAADYLGQAERLLGEGPSGMYDHVPAAVLLGAVLEKSLRTLCARQTPPLPSVDARGAPKSLNPLIDDLTWISPHSRALAGAA